MQGNPIQEFGITCDASDNFRSAISFQTDTIDPTWKEGQLQNSTMAPVLSLTEKLQKSQGKWHKFKKDLHPVIDTLNRA